MCQKQRQQQQNNSNNKKKTKQSSSTPRMCISSIGIISFDTHQICEVFLRILIRIVLRLWASRFLNTLGLAQKAIIMTSHKYNDCSNNRQRDCLFNILLMLTSMETSKLRIVVPLWEESTGDRWFPLTKGQYCIKRFHDNEIEFVQTKGTPC